MIYKTRSDLLRVIEKGKPEKVLRDFARSILAGEQYEEWREAKLAEYEALPQAEIIDVPQDRSGAEAEATAQAVPEAPPSFERWLERQEPFEAVVTEADVDALLDDYWVQRRRAAYGTWQEQLDLIYNDEVAWRAKMSKVKADIKKPSQAGNPK